MEIRQQDSDEWVGDRYKFFMRDVDKGIEIIDGEETEMTILTTVYITNL